MRGYAREGEGRRWVEEGVITCSQKGKAPAVLLGDIVGVGGRKVMGKWDEAE